MNVTIYTSNPSNPLPNDQDYPYPVEYMSEPVLMVRRHELDDLLIRRNCMNIEAAVRDYETYGVCKFITDTECGRWVGDMIVFRNPDLIASSG